MEDREDEIKYCTQCMNCEELMIRQQPVGCVAFNKIYTEKFVETRKNSASSRSCIPDHRLRTRRIWNRKQNKNERMSCGFPAGEPQPKTDIQEGGL